jgi:competence protein ComEA
MLAALERSVLFSGVPRPQPSGSPGAAAGGPGARPAPRPGQEACPDGPVPLNDATPRELECLKGVGPALAARIVADRTLHGRFGTVEDLDRVPGVGKGLVERLRPSLRVP